MDAVTNLTAAWLKAYAAQDANDVEADDAALLEMTAVNAKALRLGVAVEVDAAIQAALGDGDGPALVFDRDVLLGR